MSVRCLHKNSDRSEIVVFMKKYVEERKRGNIINRKHVFPLAMLPHLLPIAF